MSVRYLLFLPKSGLSGIPNLPDGRRSESYRRNRMIGYELARFETSDVAASLFENGYTGASL
jgi:hypothetical protein